MAHKDFEYIREQYSVPAEKGGRVIAYGEAGVITGVSGAYLLIQLDGENHSDPYHPTDGIEYHAAHLQEE